jgi:signal transduction histidine kinase
MSEGMSNKAAVLILDDDFIVKRLLEDLLDDEYECVLAGSVKEALTLLEAKEFSIVISDINMAGITSLELISLVSARAPDTVVVMTGGERTIKTAIDALRAGAFDYITVPSDLEQVLPSVKRALRHHELLKEKRVYENRLVEILQRGRALEETRAFIAHEFRHALTPLNAYVKMLAEALTHSEDRERFLALTERIQKQTDTAFDLVNQYLDYSRPLVPQFERTNINDLLRQGFEEFKAELEDRKIVLRPQFTENAIAEVDKGMMSQVLRNILVNAIQAMDEGGRLDVATHLGEESVAISISDTGAGIKSEHLNHMFEIGFTTKSGARGVGIGLALSKRIIEEAHYGSLAITNRDSQGATVVISIPTKQPEINEPGINNGKQHFALAHR